MIQISIIGSASAKNKPELETRLTLNSWNDCCQKVERYLATEYKWTTGNDVASPIDWSKVHLVSGGAAWSDHIAVALYLSHPDSQLTLHLPCPWDTTKRQFSDNGKSHWAQNPGPLANRYHQHYQTKTGIDSLAQIQQAIQQGAKIVDHYKGFQARNLVVGQSPVLIAFSFGLGDKPNDGGTAHTWNHATSSQKIYYTIGTL